MANVNNLVLQKTDLDLNTSAALPMGSSTQGASGLAGTTQAALTVGYESDKNDFDPTASDMYDANEDGGGTPCYVDPAKAPQGFLGRAQGWQR